MKFKIVHYVDVKDQKAAESLCEASADAIESALLPKEFSIKSEVVPVQEVN